MNDEDLEAGVAIVDIGGGTTDMAVFYDGILKHTAVIPYAGVNITNDIRTGLGVLRAQAEQMKTQFGTALADEANANAYITIPGLRGLPPKEISVKTLAHIIQARMEEILDYVMYHLKQIDLDKRLYGGIILTGGGAQLKHLIQLTEYKTGLGARLGFPNEHLAAAHADDMSNPMYSTCIGLILRGYHDWESGRLRFVSDVAASAPVEVEAAVATATAAPVETVVDTMPEGPADPIDVKPRSDKFKKLFDGMKDKFLRIFEEEPDQELH
jgi:cell division protein FtsA